MQNDKAKFKIEFKKRDYAFILKLIEFIDGLPKDNVSCDQLLRSGTSILGNRSKDKAASSKRDFTNYFNIALKSAN